MTSGDLSARLRERDPSKSDDDVLKEKLNLLATAFEANPRRLVYAPVLRAAAVWIGNLRIVIAGLQNQCSLLRKDRNSWKAEFERTFDKLQAADAEIASLRAELKAALAERDEARDALRAGVRAANLALFVIRKQGVMPNSSWESGFESDIAKAEATLRALGSQDREPINPSNGEQNV